METIVFEYDIQSDVMSFSRNVTKFIPCQVKISNYSETLEIAGKICPDDVKRAIMFFRPMRYDSPGRREFFRCMDFNGSFCWYKVSGKTIMDENNRPALLYGTYKPVNIDDETEGSEIRSVADELTGLDTESEFSTKLNSALEERAVGEIPNLILVELPGYEKIVNEEGKERADTLIVDVSRIFKRSLRVSDIVGRLSPNSFIIHMRGITDSGIVADKSTYFNRAIKNIWTNSFVDNPENIVLIGVAITADDSVPDYAGMLEKAREAAKEAKKEERGGLVIFDTEMRGRNDIADKHEEISDIRLIKSVLDPIMSLAYAIDEDYNLLYMNQVLCERFSEEQSGRCYEVLKGRSEPCKDCPIALLTEGHSSADGDVYSPYLRTDIHTRITRISTGDKRQAYVLLDVNEDAKAEMQNIHKSMERFNDAIYRASDIIWEINLTKNTCTRVREENIMYVLDSYVADYEKLRKQYLDHVIHYDDREDFLYVTDPGYFRESRKKGESEFHRQVRLLHQDGTFHWYDINTVFLPMKEEEEDELVFITAKDINEIKNDIARTAAVENKYKAMLDNNVFLNELAQDNERYEHVNELTGIYVFEYNAPEQSYYICSNFEDMFVLEPDMKDNAWSLLESFRVSREDRQRYEEFIENVKTEPNTHKITVRIINKHNIPRWFTVTVQTLNGLNNQLTRVTGILQDVNSEMEIKAELEFRADYDSLTKLYNAEAFYRIVSEKIHVMKDTRFAIVAMDIEHFRIINDRFGVETGNRCLVAMGQAIQDSLSKDGVAGRYEADMFSILISYRNDQDILDYIRKVNTLFDFEEAKLCGSILCFGIYKITNRDVAIRLMCDRARLAKKDIKGNMLTNFAIYDDRIRLMQRKVSQMESEMQTALDKDEFVMFLQPKMDLKTEKICGAEALVRWDHPTGGLRLPGEFLPYFESNGFIKKLDEYMWRTAAEYLSHLKKNDVCVPISVNISRYHIGSTDLIKTLLNLTKKYGIDNKNLELEITETLFTEDVDKLYEVMNALKAEGFVIEMDDFGTGYSSLNMLREAPVDVIKIDRYFVDEIMSTKRGRIIIENSVTMSKQLGLTVVAEGVETKDQVDFLKSINCDVAQGYYYSKPVDMEEFERMLLKINKGVD
ncbi:MAG: EAL domain-containing protein [Lachnospiraceae bacterium]|nr:EAL domain-containing protein [Lachnospiraceae bacterium]